MPVLGQELSSLVQVVIPLSVLIYVESFPLLNQFETWSNASVELSGTPIVCIRRLGTP